MLSSAFGRLLLPSAASSSVGQAVRHTSASMASNMPSLLREPLANTDPVLHELLKKERARQRNGLELIASENFTSLSVQQAVGSAMCNKYSEGYPGNRYYGGNEYIDVVEQLCRERALQAFHLSADDWGVNVQPLSGTPANFAVYTAIAGPNGRIMGLDLPDGGHLSHGFYSPAKSVSCTSLFFQSLPYKVDPITGIINYDELEKSAKLYRPKIIIAGTSCYAPLLDYARFRKIADSVGAFLLADIAHIAGLVAARAIPSAFEHADIVTTTTHKSLRGPRGALIFFRKGQRNEKTKYDLEEKINAIVFPGLQGGPHNHTIAGIATALKQAMTPEFEAYGKQMLANAKVLADELVKHGYNIATGGTQTHVVLLDLRSVGLEGAKVEHVLDVAHVTCNKNTCPGDKSALRPSGLRLGTPALTSRGLKEADFVAVAGFIHKGIQIALKYHGGANEKIAEFKQSLKANADAQKELAELGKVVQEFAGQFDIPGSSDF